jgi:uncharacterized protein (TIGR00251 family)
MDMICKNFITNSENEIQIRLHVIPGSSKSVFPSGFDKWRKILEIKVKSKAKENKANIEVIKKIASFFNISAKNINIIAGQKSREKIVSIKNIELNKVCKKIEDSLNEL